MRAWLALRNELEVRKESFIEGLEACGYQVIPTLPTTVGKNDILVIWNRFGIRESWAKRFESEGRPVWVAENAAWGNSFAGDRWYSIARNYHNTAGMFSVGGHERWDSLGVNLAPWRTEGETVILPQRGIGPKEVAMPRAWKDKMIRDKRGRVRNHPGDREVKPLEEDLANAGKVITWGSGAAIKALMWGIPVESHMPNWIGEQDNTDAGRLAMFRRLAWATWRLSDIQKGTAFRMLSTV